MKPSLLIVDDDSDILAQMKWALTNHYEVHLAGDRATALECFRTERPIAVLLDLGLPPEPANSTEGLATLSALLAVDKSAKVIVVTGQGEKSNALRAIGAGAYDFLTKPIEMDELKVILKRVFHVGSLEAELSRPSVQENNASFEGMLGTSPQMQQVFSSIRKLAMTEAPVLILGESGTGKEKAALAIHRTSSRRSGPFVPINCGAIPENLLESELFGHEKGAFTGAHMQREGRIASAADGTLFLDEIGEIPLHLQVKLLRFLQEQRIQRIGGKKEVAVNTRIIAATNADLQKSIQEEQFREDLYYRLAVVVLQLPPLRERPGDVLHLAHAFLHKYLSEQRKRGLRFDKSALVAMEQFGWPGNIRELENRIRRAVIMADGTRIFPADLELPEPSPTMTLKEAREQLELQLVQQALQRNNGKISSAAQDLGVSRPTLYDLLDRFSLQQKP
jgi:two-component system, NtrC family, response regulator